MTIRSRPCLALPLLLMLSATLAGAQTPKLVAANRATISMLYGNVQIRHGGAEWYPARFGEVLNPGDALKTGAKSRAEMSFGKGSTVRLEQKTEVQLVRMQGGAAARVKAFIGGVWVTLSKAFGAGGGMEVEMPGVVAATRSTIFRCEVGSDGSCGTSVYEGRVAVQGAQGEEVVVTPALAVSVPAGLKPLLGKMDQDKDDADEWVVYNRQRDVLSQLGEPTVLVALTQPAGAGWQLAPQVSQAVVDDLLRRGFDVRLPSAEEAALLTYDAVGMVAGGVAVTAADYVVTGTARTERAAPVDGNRLTTMHLAVLLRDLQQHRDLLQVKTELALNLAADEPDERIAQTLADTAGPMLGEDLGPRIVRELMIDRPGMVRVDMRNVNSRQQVDTVRGVIAELAGVERTLPLPAYGARVSLAVAGDVDSTKLAAALREKIGDTVDGIMSTRRVVNLRFKDLPPQQ